MSSYLFGDTITMLGKAMDIGARRNKLISSNLANIDTVGYKPKDIDFQSALKKELDSPVPQVGLTNPKHIPIENIFQEKGKARDQKLDQQHLDTVDIDIEMKNLSENNIQFQVSTEMLLRKIAMLKTSIVEGGS